MVYDGEEKLSSNLFFRIKNETENQFHSTVKPLLSDYQSKKLENEQLCYD